MANEAQQKEEGKKTKRTSAKKREIQDQRKRLQNRAFRSEVRSMIKQFRDCVESKDSEKQKACLASVYSLVDKGVNRAIFKRNKANRIKARLTAAMYAKTK